VPPCSSAHHSLPASLSPVVPASLAVALCSPVRLRPRSTTTVHAKPSPAAATHHRDCPHPGWPLLRIAATVPAQGGRAAATTPTHPSPAAAAHRRGRLHSAQSGPSPQAWPWFYATAATHAQSSPAVLASRSYSSQLSPVAAAQSYGRPRQPRRASVPLQLPPSGPVRPWPRRAVAVLAYLAAPMRHRSYPHGYLHPGQSSRSCEAPQPRSVRPWQCIATAVPTQGSCVSGSPLPPQLSPVRLSLSRY
jgi:hypothetical protein